MQFVNLQRFDFGTLRDFSRPKDAANDDVAPASVKEEPAAPPPPPPPTFTVEQLERERQSAHQQGFEKGVKEGMEKARKADADRESALLALMQQWNELITTFRTDYVALIEGKRQETTKLSYEIARTVAQGALQEDSASLVRSLVSDCLPYLMSEPVLTLTIHPANAAMLKEWFSRIAADHQYDGMLRIQEDAAMSVTDGRLTWANGDAETRQEHIWQRIRNRLHIQPEPQPSAPPAHEMGPDTAKDESGLAQTQQNTQNTSPEPSPTPME